MEQSEKYQRARGRAEVKYRFFLHAAVFVAVMLLLIVIDLLTSPGESWFIWPLFGWGFAVVLHGARVFLFGDKNPILDAMTEQELRKSDGHKRDEMI